MKKLISLISIIVMVIINVLSPYIFGFETEFSLGYENYIFGILQFPLFIPPEIGLGLVFFIVIFVCCIILTKKALKVALNDRFYILLVPVFFVLFIGLNDFAFWDIPETYYQPDLQFLYSYQQNQHASIDHGSSFWWLGYSLIFINSIVLFNYLRSVIPVKVWED